MKFSSRNRRASYYKIGEVYDTLVPPDNQVILSTIIFEVRQVNIRRQVSAQQL